MSTELKVIDVLNKVESELLNYKDILKVNSHMNSGLTEFAPDDELRENIIVDLTNHLKQSLASFRFTLSTTKIVWIATVKSNLVDYLKELALNSFKDFNQYCMVANAYVNHVALLQGVDYGMYLEDLIKEIVDSDDRLVHTIATAKTNGYVIKKQ